MQTIDARGLSCPEPVLRTRRAIQSLAAGEEILVLVESATSRENVRRAAASMGCSADITSQDETYRVQIRKA